MSGVNKVILVGNVGRDPELRTTTTGQQVAGFSLATSRSWSDKQGQRQEKTQWHRVVAWEKQAELCAEYLRKGEKVYIEGELNYRDFEHEGKKRQVCEVRVLRIEFLGAKKNDAPSHSAAGRKAGESSVPAHSAGKKDHTQAWSEGDFADSEVPF